MAAHLAMAVDDYVKRGVTPMPVTIASAGDRPGAEQAGELLYEVSATHPRTLIAAALAGVAVAVLAAYVPARRAGRVDPVVVLRQE